MPTILRWIFLFFVVAFGLTSLLTLGGVGYLWFIDPQAQMPFLRWLLGLTLAEALATVVVLAKRGVYYLPEVQSDRDRQATFRFMKNFISHGKQCHHREQSACMAHRRRHCAGKNDGTCKKGDSL